jgi:hypothetical protein
MTRRGVLAAAGTSLFAGCNEFAGSENQGNPTIQAHDVPDIDPDEDPKPAVPESVPVGISPDHFDAARHRVTTLLAELPIPLGPTDIPNGHVREQLSDAASDAADALNDARNARTAFVALGRLQQARAAARYAAAGWAVADQNLSSGPIKREHDQIVSEAQAIRDSHEHVGTDPIEAALVHARIEDMLAQVIDGRTIPTRDGNQLLDVAEWGETAESARAHLNDARHLDEQFSASLPTDSGTVRQTLSETAETLLADIRTRTSELPPEPTDEEWGISERVIGDLRREADDGVARIADANGPASAIIDANERLTRFLALDRLLERIDNGEITRPQTPEAVREIRTNAHEALYAALDESPAPDLTRTAITGAAWRIASADWELARYEGEIRISRLDTNVVDYVIAAAIGRAAPDVSRQVLEKI